MPSIGQHINIFVGHCIEASVVNTEPDGSVPPPLNSTEPLGPCKGVHGHVDLRQEVAILPGNLNDLSH